MYVLDLCLSPVCLSALRLFPACVRKLDGLVGCVGYAIGFGEGEGVIEVEVALRIPYSYIIKLIHVTSRQI